MSLLNAIFENFDISCELWLFLLGSGFPRSFQITDVGLGVFFAFSFSRWVELLGCRVLVKLYFGACCKTKFGFEKRFLGSFTFRILSFLSEIKVYFGCHVFHIASVWEWFCIIKIHWFLYSMKHLITLHELAGPCSNLRWFMLTQDLNHPFLYILRHSINRQCQLGKWRVQIIHSVFSSHIIKPITWVLLDSFHHLLFHHMLFLFSVVLLPGSLSSFNFLIDWFVFIGNFSSHWTGSSKISAANMK